MTSDVPPTPPQRTFRRSTTDRHLGGVAGGLARRFDVDVAVVRIALVGVTTYLAFSSTSAAYLLVLLAYALAWAMVPTDSGRSLLGRLPARPALQELGLMVVLLVVAMLAVDQPGALVVAALGGLAAVLLRDRPTDADATPVGDTRPDPPVDPGPGPESGEEDTTTVTTAVAGPATPDRTLLQRVLPGPTAERRPAPPRRAKREPALWPLALGLLVVVIVGAVALDGVLGQGVDPRIAVDLALLVVGAVLALSAWRGRARLVLLAVPILLPVWLATSVPDIGRFDGSGQRDRRPTSLPTALVDGRRTATATYEMGYGDLDVDLTALDLDAGSRTLVHVGLTAGRAEVHVPAGAAIELRGEVGLGAVRVTAAAHWQHEEETGVGRTLDASYPALHAACPVQTIGSTDLLGIIEDAGIRVAGGGAEGSTADVPTAKLLDAVADAGFPRPRVSGTVPDVSSDDPSAGNDLVDVRLTGSWELCRPVPPDPDPPTITIDATVGLGDLEVVRV
ncbi:MAG: PspC domain protein [Acidimicrobiales bacterium]|nr:PspC domain protein [Acidimicrobiales bacterium]